jgi:hypothetical protein
VEKEEAEEMKKWILQAKPTRRGRQLKLQRGGGKRRYYDHGMWLRI